MNTKLPILLTIKNSFEYIFKNLPIIACFYVFSFSAIYLIQRFNAAQSMLVMLGYLIYTYLFYYFFVSVYFKQKPLFNRQNFYNSLIRIAAILLLAFATLLLIKVGFQILFLLVKPLKVFPEFYDYIRMSYISFIKWQYFAYFLYIFMFLVLTIIFFIPAFAWISSINGRDSSITLALLKSKNNYWRLFFIFALIYGVLPFGALFFSNSSIIILSALSALFTIVQVIIYLKIYEFFYQD